MLTVSTWLIYEHVAVDFLFLYFLQIFVISSNWHLCFDAVSQSISNILTILSGVTAERYRQLKQKLKSSFGARLYMVFHDYWFPIMLLFNITFE